MNKKGNLFFLIQSLSKSEKRYFKIFCFSQKVNNNYLRLFEAIEQQTIYDEREIKTQFEGEVFIKQLHVTKNYLSQLILKSLRNYHSTISKQATLNDCLRNIELLFLRELYDQCYYELIKAEKIALTYQKPQAQLEIIGWKKKLVLTTRNSRIGDLTQLIQKEKEILQELQYINHYWTLTNSIRDFQNDQEGELLKQPEMQRKDDQASLPAEILRHHILYTYHVVNGNTPKGIDYLKALIQLQEQYPQIIKDDPGSYVTALNNLLGSYIFDRQFEQVFPLLEKVKAVPQKFQLNSSGLFTIKLRLRTYNIELEAYRDTKQWVKGIQLIEEIIPFLEVHEKAVTSDYFLRFWYQFANIYFMEKDYSNALKWVNAILNKNFKALHLNLQCYARILNLMIHFEMGNTFVLKYAVDSTRRFLKKNQDIAAVAQIVLRFFSKISNAPKSEYSLLFRYLYADLLESDPPLANADVLDYLDFKSFIARNLS